MLNDTGFVIEAVVQKVIPEGQHGPFAVATAVTTEKGIEGSITFSLNEDVWDGTIWPEPGEFVLLSKIRKKRAGWRALKARYYQPKDKQIAHRKEHAMKDLWALVERWKAKLFPRKTDIVWKEWVDLHDRGWNDLKRMIADAEVKDEYKARALFIMFTPDLAWCPFYWIDHDRIFVNNGSYVESRRIGLDVLSPDLLQYAAGLIKEMYRHFKRRPTEDDIKKMETYNWYVIDLLALLPEDEAEKIFPLLELKDFSVWWNMDFASGYTFFESLLQRQNVADHWKIEADRQMREHVRREEFGSAQPRIDHERAIAQYAQIIQNNLYDFGPIYSAKLFVDQIRFIVSLNLKKAGAPRRPLIDRFKISQIIKVIKEEGDQKLLNLFIQYILDDERPFQVHDMDSLRVVEMMWNEFGGNDKTLIVLQEIVLAGRHKIAQETMSSKEQKRAEDALFKKMRHSGAGS